MRSILSLAFVALIIGCAPQEPQAKSDVPEQAQDALFRGNALIEAGWEISGSPAEDIVANLKDVDEETCDKAVAAYDEALKIDPDYAEAYFRRGLVHLGRGKLDEAVSDFSDAIRVDPKHARAFLFRARAYAELDEPDKSKQDREEALRLDPGLG